MSYENKFRDHVRRLIAAYCDATQPLTLGALGKRLFRDPTMLLIAEEGSNRKFGVHIFDRIVAVFSANWPEGAVWPEGIERVSLDEVRVPVPRGPRSKGEPSVPRLSTRAMIEELRAQVEQLQQVRAQ